MARFPKETRRKVFPLEEKLKLESRAKLNLENAWAGINAAQVDFSEIRAGRVLFTNF